jgi:hypothetical protein
MAPPATAAAEIAPRAKAKPAMKLPAILQAFRRPPAEASATDLRAALHAAEAQHAASVTLAADLQAAHGEMLLSDDPTAAAKHEAEMTAARAEAGRAAAVIPAIAARLEQAEAREAEAALLAEVEEGERFAVAAAEDLRKYEDVAFDLLLVVDRIDAAAAHVRALNARLQQRGRRDLQVTPPISRVWPNRPGGDYLGNVLIPAPAGTASNLRQLEQVPPAPVRLGARE